VTHKAVILARGLGTRMQHDDGESLNGDADHMARQGMKALIPLRGRPFLDYAVGGLIDAGAREVCLVIAPEADVLRRYAERTTEASGVEVTCAVQQEPLGTADAVLAAEQWAAGDSFVMCNGDDLYPDEALHDVLHAEEGSCYVVAFERDAMAEKSNFAPERVRSFAVVVAAADGWLQDIIEKPPDPDRYAQEGAVWVNMNLYRFTADIFDACHRIEPHPERGERELTAAVSLLVREGAVPFRVLLARGAVLDLTSRADVHGVERLLGDRTPGF